MAPLSAMRSRLGTVGTALARYGRRMGGAGRLGATSSPARGETAPAGNSWASGPAAALRGHLRGFASHRPPRTFARGGDNLGARRTLFRNRRNKAKVVSKGYLDTLVGRAEKSIFVRITYIVAGVTALYELIVDKLSVQAGEAIEHAKVTWSTMLGDKDKSEDDDPKNVCTKATGNSKDGPIKQTMGKENDAEVISPSLPGNAKGKSIKQTMGKKNEAEVLKLSLPGNAEAAIIKRTMGKEKEAEVIKAPIPGHGEVCGSNLKAKQE